MTDDWAIAAHGLQKSYGSAKVLDGVDLMMPAGTVLAMLGPNGAGKTTMVRILSTLIRPDAGEARVAGFDIIRERHLVRRSISLTGQNVAIDELQTGAENLRMMARLSGLSARQSRVRATELLRLFELTEHGNKRVAAYSGGMRRRLDLAAGMVGRPAVIFLDEPTTGLDLPSRQGMWRIISELVRSGVSVFLTTQYLEEADRVANQIAVVNGGALVAQGTPAELKNEIADQRLDLVMTDQAAFAAVCAALGDRVITSNPDHCRVSVATDGTAANVRALLDEVDPKWSAVRNFSIHVASLDDVFLALTGRPAGKTTEVHEHV